MKSQSSMEWSHALKLMRIPFSLYLAPIYFFSLSNIENPNLLKGIVVFVILHLFLYPASSGYNSLCDKDTTPVGGLKDPPAVNKQLIWLVWIFDAATLITALLISFTFAACCFIILLVSKAYSHPLIRLKKYPLIGAAAVTLFQGAFTYFTVQVGMGFDPSEVGSISNILFSLVSTLFLLGSYPMTQIYQHTADREHGDKTLSIVLGINGTFVFTAIAFTLASVLVALLYLHNHQSARIVIYALSIAPLLFYFFKWWSEQSRNPDVVDYDHSMKLNMLSSVCLCVAFIAMMFF